MPCLSAGKRVLRICDGKLVMPDLAGHTGEARPALLANFFKDGGAKYLLDFPRKEVRQPTRQDPGTGSTLCFCGH
jgi:hypothetical protein